MAVLKKTLRVGGMVIIVIFSMGAYEDWTLIGSGCLSNKYQVDNILVDRENRVHIVFSVSPPVGGGEIYYRRSLNGGKDWQASIEVSLPDFYYSLSSNGENNLYLVNESYGTPDYRIFFHRSTDGGDNWGGLDTISPVYHSKSHAYLNSAATGEAVYVVRVIRDWQNLAVVPDTLFFSRSLDGGTHWEEPIPLDIGENQPLFLNDLEIAAQDSFVHLFYTKVYTDDKMYAMYRRSADYGVHWTNPVKIYNTSFEGALYNASAARSHVYIGFQGNWPLVPPRILYSQTDWKEDRWDTLELPLKGDYFAGGPILAANGNRLAVSWIEHRLDNDTISKNDSIYFYISGSPDSGRHWVLPITLGVIPESLFRMWACPRLALDDSGCVHILTYGEVGGEQGIVYGRLRLPWEEGVEEREQGHSLFLFTRPNPASKAVEIKFTVPYPSLVTLQICDLAGRVVRTLTDEFCRGNSYTVFWDGRDSLGKKLSSGVYLCRLKIGKSSVTQKIILLY